MKKNSVIDWILRLGVAVILGYMGLLKIIGNDGSVEMFTRLEMGSGGRVLIGFLEVIAAIFLLLRQSVSFGALLAWGLMTGALIAHFTKLGVKGEAGVFTLLALATWVFAAVLIYRTRSSNPLVGAMFSSNS